MRRHTLALFVLSCSLGCKSDQGYSRIKQAPEVAITSPEEMVELRQGEGPQPFAGLVEDEYDAPGDLTVHWSLDGGRLIPVEPDALGEVRWEIEVDSLEWGEHLVSLQAVDTDGQEESAELRWLLSGPITTPIVEITAPEDGSVFEPEEEVVFRGEASDETTPANELRFVWASDRDGELSGAITGEGESALFTSELSLGTHTISLSVTDHDDEVGADSIMVHIEEEVIIVDTGDTGDTGIVKKPPELEPGDLVFSELMINPQVVADESGEWVELYNTASYTIDIGGYTFHDLDFDEYVLEGPILVDGYDYVVLCADMSTLSNGGVPCDAPFKRKSADALALGNGTDEVILSRADGIVIDEVYYTEKWYTTGVAIGVDPTYLDAKENDDLGRWCNQTTVISTGGEPGTPGEANDPCF